MDEILFQEKQKFTQWWLWLMLFGISMIVIFFNTNTDISEKQLINQDVTSDSNTVSQVLNQEYLSLDVLNMLPVLLPILLLVILFLILFLETKISTNSIEIRFFPFVKKNVKWTDVASATVVDYGFVGGWGIRLWTKFGTVYNIRGKMGLALELKDGSKFLIGSQQPTALSQVIQTKLKQV